MEQIFAEKDESKSTGGGLDYGITLWHYRVLIDNPFDGGGGYSPRELAKWTPDQIYFRLSNRKTLEGKTTGVGSKVKPAQIRTNKDGIVAGRDSEGNPIRAKIHGKSLAARLREKDPEAIRMAKKRTDAIMDKYGDDMPMSRAELDNE